MKEPRSRADEARAKAAKEIQRAELEDALAAALPKGYPFKIHGRGLYGSVASAELAPEDKMGGYFPDRSKIYRPTPGDVSELAEALPPVPLVHRANGCTSFVPADYEDPREHHGTREPVAPFIWNAETMNNRGTFVALEWFADVKPFGRIQVAVEMDAQQDVNQRLGRIEIKWKSLAGYEQGRATNIESCRYLHPGALDALGGGMRTIKWASGGLQYANRFTLYWLDTAMTVKAVIDRVCETPGERAERGAKAPR